MKAGKRIFYWDTAVLLAWLMDERHWPTSVLEGIQDVVSEVENGTAIMFTSSMTRSEIFRGRLSPEQKDKYAKLMLRRTVTEIAPDARVMDRASAIREYYANEKPKRSISTPDAIHLATAIIYKADEFQTMDGLEQGGTKRTKLLALSGNVAGYNLPVVQPYPRNRPPAELVSIEGPLFPKKDDKTNGKESKSK
jgi:predicted nucleic acid-binding protein